MSEPYEVFLRAEAIEVLRSLPLAARRRISLYVDSLASSPSSTGDYSMKDKSGRIIEMKVVGSHAVTFWADHAVREIKIIDIRNADHA